MIKIDPNPYAPLPALCKSVDREQRDGLVEIIERFLNEESTAFEFDEALDDYRGSDDATVKYVAEAVWYHYDDCEDHLVTMSKPEWDYFQRLLLLLKSEGEIVTDSKRNWSWTQLAAVASLLVFLWFIWQFGWGYHLLAFSIPLGIVSITITFVRQKSQTRGPYDYILSPFPTFSDLSATYRSVVSFSKKRYPGKLVDRKIRSRVAEFGVPLQFYASWLMLAPIPLFFQAFPTTETTVSVKTATDTDRKFDFTLPH